ncbi:hypothetical protein ENSA5_70260 [Enhygromyxa salina]|uniref:Uncharacterized protein n=1 Tax=Enhygromyxa salina TaxID=215803 RepID=A0A2S9XAI0_9BACT|nr:hypothetical protein [Enhygromyxa salina]PRP89872.1 hypothetical protein ENSA5_70260 [Enhygromyxa salina]
MFYANIHIDLPSEPALHRRTLLDWFSELIGREPTSGADVEVITVTGLSVFKPVTDALAQLGITDVLSVIVDGRIAYVDTEENSGDLATAIAELDARAVLEREFEAMKMVLSHRRDGLRTLIEVTVRRRVPAGSPELVIALAARLDSMQIARGESPTAYAERLRAIAADVPALEAARERFAALADEAKRALDEQLGELVVSSSVAPVELRLIRPGPRQLDHFRRLSWGPSVRMPKYRPVPIRSRLGAYDEPFYHYYFDPYFDFVAWVTLTEIVAGRGWQGLSFEVVNTDGARVFGARDALGEAALGGEYGPPGDDEALVRVTERAVEVSPRVPTFTGPDPGEISDPRVTPGFGGDGRGDGQAAGAGWNEARGGPDGADLGGSCGASCGGCGGG